MEYHNINISDIKSNRTDNKGKNRNTYEKVYNNRLRKYRNKISLKF